MVMHALAIVVDILYWRHGMSVVSRETVDSWLKEIGLKSLERTESGNWYFFQKYQDSEIQINISYNEKEPPLPPMIGVGCHFLDPPEKNNCELYKKLLELQTVSAETKFGILSSGAIVLATQRSAMNLDQSELRDMIDMILVMYNQFHQDCLAIMT
jgi:hypothetical protein